VYHASQPLSPQLVALDASDGFSNDRFNVRIAPHLPVVYHLLARLHGGWPILPNILSPAVLKWGRADIEGAARPTRGP